MTNPSTANEKVLKEFDEWFRMDDAFRVGKAVGHGLSGEIKAFIVRSLNDRAEEIAVEIERCPLTEMHRATATEIARSFKS